MNYVDEETGELFDSNTVCADIRGHLNALSTIYKQLKKYEVIKDDVHKKTFDTGLDIIRFMVNDIDTRIKTRDDEIFTQLKERNAYAAGKNMLIKTNQIELNIPKRRYW